MFLQLTHKINVKHLILTFIVFFITTSYSFAQLTTNSNLTLQSIVNSLVGSGVTYSSVKYTGATTARGSFNGVKSNIGLKGGIIISTGAIDSATGPNHTPSDGSCALYNSGTNFGLSGDADLDSIAGAQGTVDAAVLEFDFVPQSSPISFNYVFASNEYPCFVCSHFNDIFAFLITGPNPVSGQPAYMKKNIAIIPSSNPPTYVAINSVNSGIPGPGSSSTDCTSLKYSQDYIDNGNGSTPKQDSTVAYHGFTTPFIATIKVVPCRNYHIKLAIADWGDGGYDSAVLLQASSFSSSALQVTSTYTNSAIDSAAVKGCNNAVVTFTLPKPALQDTNIIYTIGGTAENGKDYKQLSGTIFIQKGQTTSSFTLVPIPYKPGFNHQGALTFTYRVTLSSCHTQTFTVNILEHDFKASISPSSPDSICVNKTQTFTVTGLNSHGYSYKWNNDSTYTSFSVTNDNMTNSIVDTTFFVTVTDYQKCNIIDTLNVYKIPDVSKLFTISPDSGFTPLTVNFKYTGTDNATWIFGDDTPSALSKLPEFNHVFKYNSSKDKGNGFVTYYAKIKMGPCEDLSEIIVKVPLILNIPNVFTPNGDNKDENFSIQGNGIMSAEVSIYNRLGVKIFSKTYDVSSLVVDHTLPSGSSNTNNYIMWDGKNMSGNKVDDGVYFYVLKPVGTDGNKINPRSGKLEGSLTILK